jgi:hypothetical protein
VEFSFRKLGVLENADPNSTVDVCGVVKRCGDCQDLMSKKTGSALFKQDLALAEVSVCETKRDKNAIA